MNIDSIRDGVVIDHITAGRGMRLYELLHLDDLDCSVAIIKNVTSKKMAKKDIIKIDSKTHINMDVIGFQHHPRRRAGAQALYRHAAGADQRHPMHESALYHYDGTGARPCVPLDGQRE